MDVGIHFLNFTNPGGDAVIAPLLADTAKAADDAGFALFTVMDHFFQMERVWPAENPMLEGYTALGYVAALTSRIELATLVTGVTYRHPGLLAKTVTTLDVLSGGRAILGLGAAWYEREHNGLGVPFPPLKERFERLEETLRICLQMWSDDDGAYAGRHYTLAETLNRPRSLQRPRPQILVGATASRRRCGSSRSTRTPATSRSATSTRSATRSAYCGATVTGRAATSATSGSPCRALSTRSRTRTASCAAPRSWPRSACGTCTCGYSSPTRSAS
ncbi:hypothetical protein Pflav_042570 [Phytohabitans flavus]|uniref:Luciferase-like domain-containing protein n=1 Tax=Phytohabitans flavus TaxID=1076124 RepID=A0A6F8XVM9_9ACTN|nr:TIGR03560 family F420-dependent LLM class oxidoreductase [Phytohabitans flavus]BCB77847.1 hypothetical protein Pflav_042570 [Phytohabitans flavus]